MPAARSDAAAGALRDCAQPTRDGQRRNHRPGRETVQPVGQVHRVHRSGDGENAEREPEPMRRRQRERSGVERTSARKEARRCGRSHAGRSTAASAVAKNFVRARNPRFARVLIAKHVVDQRRCPRRARRATRNSGSNGTRLVASVASSTSTKTQAAHRRRAGLCVMRLRRVFVGALPDVEAPEDQEQRSSSERRDEKSEEHPKTERGSDGAFTISLSQQRIRSAPRHLSTTTGVCSSLLPCGLSSSARSTFRALTPARSTQNLCLVRDRWHRRPRMQRRFARRQRSCKAVRVARREDDRALVGRHRAGVSVDRRRSLRP